MKFLLFAVLAIAASHGVSAKCNIHPKYWCDSVATAKKCNALLQCQDYFMTVQSGDDSVKVDLYYEALCPYCRQFITEQLFPVWNKLYDTKIMNVTIVPYGNALETEISPGKYRYECQHGPDECTLNAIENCVMDATDNVIEKYFPVINCIEASDQPMNDSEKCVTKAGLVWKTVNDCATGSQGNALVHKSAVKTSALQPAHQYVPWIVVNGEHTDEMQQDAQQDLLKFVCSTYTGKKPDICGKSRYIVERARSMVEK